jgi:hypothetical protein
MQFTLSMTQQVFTRLAVVIVAAGLIAGCGGSSDSAVPSTAPSPVATPAPTPSPTPSPTPQPSTSGCTTTVSGLPSSVPAPFGRYPFSIATGPTCAWSARTDVDWADVAPGSGQGSVSLLLNVSENMNRDPRTITVTVNGQSFRIVQQVPSCTYSVEPKKLDLGGLAGGVVINLTTGKDCPWSASASESWIHVVTPSGAGSAEVTFQLDTNPNGSLRTGYVTVAGLRIDVTQQRKP